MKRFLLSVAFVLLATAAFAANVADRDVLIATDGTVFSVASQPSDDGLASSLALTIQSGDKSSLSVLPATIDNGINSHPALAYDADSKTLFVFWQRLSATAESELLITSYKGGEWQPAVSVDYKQTHRYNLGVALTRHVQQLSRNNNEFETVPALVLHAVWWEEGNGGQGAHYAVMGLRGGAIVEPDVHDMSDFVADRATAVAAAADDNLNRDLMRQVALLDGPTNDSVDVLYSDTKTRSFYRTTLRPIADGRLHIPAGARGPSPQLGAPHAYNVDWSGHSGTISSRDGNALILYNIGAEKVNYVQYANGKWSDAQQVALSDKLSAEAAVAALAKMLAVSAE